MESFVNKCGRLSSFHAFLLVAQKKFHVLAARSEKFRVEGQSAKFHSKVLSQSEVHMNVSFELKACATHSSAIKAFRSPKTPRMSTVPPPQIPKQLPRHDQHSTEKSNLRNFSCVKYFVAFSFLFFPSVSTGMGVPMVHQQPEQFFR